MPSHWPNSAVAIAPALTAAPEAATTRSHGEELGAATVAATIAAAASTTTWKGIQMSKAVVRERSERGIPSSIEPGAQVLGYIQPCPWPAATCA